MRQWGLYSLVIATILIADRITKVMALDSLSDGPVTVLPVFNLVLVWNRGVSFGLFTQDSTTGPYILSGLSFLIVLALFIWLIKTDFKPLGIALSAVIAGAIGNIIDRLVYGAVIDFLDFHVAGYHWPAFNIADSAIVLGIVFIAVDGLFWEPKRKQTAADTRGTAE